MKENPVIFFLNIIKTILLLIFVFVTSIVFAIIALIVGIISRKGSYYIAKTWAIIVGFVCGVKVIVRGIEKIDQSKNYLIISNHLSYFDIIALYIAIPLHVGFIARSNLFLIPFWGWALFFAGHIPINRSNPKKASRSLQMACNIVKKKKRSIVGFPEGTRSKSGIMAPFKLGLFNLAIRAGIDILPVATHGTREILRPKGLIIRSGKVYIDILNPIPIQGYSKRDKATLADKAWQLIHDGVEEEKKKRSGKG